VRAKDAVGRYGEDVAEAHVRERGWDVMQASRPVALNDVVANP
jgi:hypothetical protein